MRRLALGAISFWILGLVVLGCSGPAATGMPYDGPAAAATTDPTVTPASTESIPLPPALSLPPPPPCDTGPQWKAYAEKITLVLAHEDASYRLYVNDHKPEAAKEQAIALALVNDALRLRPKAISADINCGATHFQGR